MTKEQFIKEAAKYVLEFAPKYDIKVCSAPLAQIILESACGTSELAINAHNYSGLKYRAGRCPSSNGIYYKDGAEQDPITGEYTNSAMQWFKFPDMRSGIQGYFDFTNISNYKSLKGVTDPQTYLENIKAAGYATSFNFFFVSSVTILFLRDFEIFNFVSSEHLLLLLPSPPFEILYP